MVLNKRGDEKYYIIISLILGIIVLGLSLYFIFQEYFNQDDIDWEACRQSVILRANLPEADLKVLSTDLKGAYPLKCKTQVITIDKAKKPEDVWKPISDTIVSGWYAYGEGKMEFLHRDLSKDTTYCLVIARIRYTEKAMNDLEKNDFWKSTLNKRYPHLYEGRVSYADIFSYDFGRYYLDTPFRDTEKYHDYLPLYLGGEVSDKGNLIFPENVQIISYGPDHLFLEDRFLVYRATKVNAVAKGILNNKFTQSIAAGVAWVSFGRLTVLTSERIKEIEKIKSIWILSLEDLDKIDCDEYLTIPA